MLALHAKPLLLRSEAFGSCSRKPFSVALRRSRCLANRGPSAQGDPIKQKKKFITKEEEPEQYWKSEGERAGNNPMKDPLAIIGLIAIFAPFIILGIAIAVGYVDLTPY